MRLSSLILVCLFVLDCSNAFGQADSYIETKADWNFLYLDNSNGLLHNEVNAITQDKRGYIWLGTPKGLQRYDGLRFLYYKDSTVKPGESIIIAGLQAADSGNSIHVRTRDWQIKEFHWLRNSFVRQEVIDNSADDNKIGPETFQDESGEEWIINRERYSDHQCKGTTISGYVTISKQNDKISDEVNERAFMLHDMLNNKIWISSAEHPLLLFDENNKRIYSKRFNPLALPLLSTFTPNTNSLWRMLGDSKGNTWFYNNGPRFYKYDAASQMLVAYDVQQMKTTGVSNSKSQTGTVTCMLEDDHGTIWVGTDNAGLFRFNSFTEKFEPIQQKQRNSEGINFTYAINALFQDREKNIWVGTDNGLTIFNPYKQYFKAIRHEENNSKSLPKALISTAIGTRSGDILVATAAGGINVYDRFRGFEKNISVGMGDENMINAFLEDDDGNIWSGSASGGVSIVNPLVLSVTNLRPSKVHNSAITAMSKDKNGNIWLGFENGAIVKWNKATKQFVHANLRPAEPGRTRAAVNHIYIDEVDNLWISSFDGLRNINPKNYLHDVLYLPDTTSNQVISSRRCFGIESYNDSILAIGTGNGGLLFFNKKSRQFSRLSIPGEQSNYSAFAVKKDNAGNIWFTTDYNIYKLSTAKNGLIACNLPKCLITSYFRPGRFSAMHNGQWLTWTYAEVIGFFPDSIGTNPSAVSPVAITGFKVSDHVMFVDPLIESQQPVRLNHRQNFINIEFASLTFLPAKQLKYFYQMLGVDEEWVPSGSNQSATYTKLSPGKYTFRVSTMPGTAGSFTSLDIIISPPFWQTWWLRLMVIGFLAFTAFLLIRRRIRAIRRESSMKQKIAETEMMALRAQMNPHFIFNCLSAIDNLIQTNQQDKATRYLARFARLIRSILHSSKNNLVPFHKDLETLTLYLELEQFRSNNKFQYEVVVDAGLQNTDLNVPPMIVQPFLENAIHHGLLNKESTNRFLDICIALKEDHILYLINDNGVGRQKSYEIKELNRPEHVSYGTQMTKDRLKLHNKSRFNDELIIRDVLEQGRPAGTIVEVKVAIE